MRLRNTLSYWLWLLAPGALLAAEPQASVAADMAEAAQRWIASLHSAQHAHALFPLPDEERFNWHFVPRERKGLSLKQMQPDQRQLAFALLASGMSYRGFSQSATVMTLEQVLHEIESGGRMRRDPELYFVSIFGKPIAEGTWAWRLEGHHLSLNFTVIEGRFISVTPSFFGANPARVMAGNRKGLRVLAADEDLARKLAKSFNDVQSKKAVIAKEAPRDIITSAERKVSTLQPLGISVAEMDDAQTALLWEIVQTHLRRYRSSIAEQDWALIQAAGPDRIHFAWAGGLDPGEGHYYRVQGPHFLMEYDNTQNQANHIHAVWRDFKNDFGEDMLARHYREHSHNQAP